MTDLNPRNWIAEIAHMPVAAASEQTVDGFLHNEKRGITYPFNYAGGLAMVRKPSKSGGHIALRATCTQAAAVALAMQAHVEDTPSAPAPAPSVAAFEVGVVYACRSICDHECIFHWKVTARTEKTITLVECLDASGDAYGEPKRKGVKVSDGEELCYPSGRFSMCPIIRPSKKVS